MRLISYGGEGKYMFCIQLKMGIHFLRKFLRRFVLFSMLYKCGMGRDGFHYPVEQVDWVSMAESEQSHWISSNIVPQTNEVLVKLGIFKGK